MNEVSPRRLPALAYEKVWGAPDTEPWFRNPEGRNIGEIWFSASDAVPLLVKFLFTSGKLSVQVHPGDEYARVRHQSCGKTEMWHILRAQPGAKIALGLRESMTPERFREAARTGAIMESLNWIPVGPGDTFFIPAGIIHAIGEGIALCEVQQRSDITYRIYDYERGRELHVDDAVAVSRLDSDEGAAQCALPVECVYFKTERLVVEGSWVSAPARRNTLYIALEGEGLLADRPFQAGEAWEVDAGSTPFEIRSAHATFLVTAEPS